MTSMPADATMSPVPAVDPTENGAPDRRAIDRRRQSPMAVYAGFLAGRPQLDDSLRMLVAMLAWPLGVKGALLLFGNRPNPLAPAAACTEQLEFWADALERTQWAEMIEAQLGNEDGRRLRVCENTEFPGLPAAACCVLGSTTRPLARVVLMLASPVSIAALQQFAAPALDQLSVYLAGNSNLLNGPSASGSNGNGSSLPFKGLTFSTRQRQVLELLEQSLTMRQIAARIGYSDSTVRMDSLAIYRALGVHDRDGAISAARVAGLLGAGE